MHVTVACCTLKQKNVHKQVHKVHTYLTPPVIFAPYHSAVLTLKVIPVTIRGAILILKCSMLNKNAVC